MSDLKQNIKNHKKIISIYGLGNVGGAIAASWLRAGSKVIGVDLSDKLLKDIKIGRSHKKEPFVSKVFSNALRELNSDNYFITGIAEEFQLAQDQLLHDLFGDEMGEVVQWWLYECGPENSFRTDKLDHIKPLIYDAANNVIADLTKIDDLYKYITENNK